MPSIFFPSVSVLMMYLLVIYHAAMDDISRKLLYGCLATLSLTGNSSFPVQPGFGQRYPLG